MSRFKHALCLAELPDTPVPGYWRRCHRHANHPGRHRIVFRDGFTREWRDGDNRSVRSRGVVP